MLRKPPNYYFDDRHPAELSRADLLRDVEERIASGARVLKYSVVFLPQAMQFHKLLNRRELVALANDWRRVLVDDPANARPIVSALLVGRVTITPIVPKRRWVLKGEGTLAGLFERAIFPSVWRPHRDSNPGFGLERATS